MKAWDAGVPPSPIVFDPKSAIVSSLMTYRTIRRGRDTAAIEDVFKLTRKPTKHRKPTVAALVYVQQMQAKQ